MKLRFLEEQVKPGSIGQLLGEEEFIENVRALLRQLAREHPRYQRREVQTSPQKITP